MNQIIEHIKDRQKDIDKLSFSNITFQEVKMLKRMEKFRTKSENQYLSLLYRYQKVSTDERFTFVKKTCEILGHECTLNEKRAYDQMAEIYIEFFESVYLLEKAMKVKLIMSNDMHRNQSFIILLLKWLLDYYRNKISILIQSKSTLIINETEPVRIQGMIFEKIKMPHLTSEDRVKNKVLYQQKKILFQRFLFKQNNYGQREMRFQSVAQECNTSSYAQSLIAYSELQQKEHQSQGCLEIKFLNDNKQMKSQSLPQKQCKFLISLKGDKRYSPPKFQSFHNTSVSTYTGNIKDSPNPNNFVSKIKLQSLMGKKSVDNLPESIPVTTMTNRQGKTSRLSDFQICKSQISVKENNITQYITNIRETLQDVDWDYFKTNEAFNFKQMMGQNQFVKRKILSFVGKGIQRLNQ